MALLFAAELLVRKKLWKKTIEINSEDCTRGACGQLPGGDG